MSSSILTTPADPLTAIRLIAERDDGALSQVEIEPGKSVMVGRGKHCGLQLDSDGIGAIQCVFRAVDDTLWIQDWYSSSGTTVDGAPVHGEIKVGDHSEIRCGDYRIRVQRGGAPAVQGPPKPGPFAKPASVTPRPVVTEPVTSTRVTSSPVAAPPSVASIDLSARPEASRSTEKPSLAAVPAARSPQSHSHGNSAFGSTDPFSQETIELLRGELEHLQQELRDREARIRELEDQAETGNLAVEEEEDASPDSFLARLDELLLELQQSDDRIAALEDLLQLSEEATAAEREERRQLENWLTDIERRVSQRDAEWQGEMDALKHRLTETEAERERLWQRVTAGDEHPAADTQWQAAETARWREKQMETERRLAEITHDRDRLAAELETVEMRSTEEGRRAELDDAFREERARIAQERAELSRQRAEMAAVRAEVPQMPSVGPSNALEIDGRLRAFREHLREIHQREQQESAQQSLAARIGKLWRRLEGR